MRSHGRFASPRDRGYRAGVLPLCFLTGASGFVGRHLAKRLARTHTLRVLVRRGQELPHLASIAHERIEGRLGEVAALQRGCQGAEVVVHLAALVSFRREDRAAMFSANAQATAELAAAARQAGVRRMLHVSTIAALAYRDRPELLDERAAYNFGPLRIGYCDSKFAGERAVLAEVKRGLDAVIVNPPSMYGPGDRRKGDGSLLGAVFAGKVRLAPPGGSNVAEVGDVCDGMLAALQHGRRGERYLLGGENLTGRDLLARIAAVVGGKAPRVTVPAFALRLAAGLLHRKERWFGSKPPLTSEVLQLAGRFQWFTSDKAKHELGWQAGSVDRGIEAAWRELQGN
jgi:dihydroflavonol-4-reductase